MRLYSFIPVLLVFLVFMSFQHKEVCIEEKCFDILRVADSDEERAQGLMNVESLPMNEAMLFVFPESGRHGFWMKNTLIPLDIIWIDSNGIVVDISYNALPCLAECPIMYPSANAKYVLEVKAGLAGDWIGKKAQL